METRDWEVYLSSKLSFPFLAERINDTDKIVFEKSDKDKPFSLGHTMKVVRIEAEDDLYGIIVRVKEGRKTAFVPLLDLKMTDNCLMNMKFLEEYAEWFANE